MKLFLRLFAAVVALFSLFALVLHVAQYFEESAGSLATRGFIGGVLNCLGGMVIAMLCLPLSGRKPGAIGVGLLAGVLAILGVIASSNIKGWHGPLYSFALANMEGIALLLTYAATPLALVAVVLTLLWSRQRLQAEAVSAQESQRRA